MFIEISTSFFLSNIKIDIYSSKHLKSHTTTYAKYSLGSWPWIYLDAITKCVFMSVHSLLGCWWHNSKTFNDVITYACTSSCLTVNSIPAFVHFCFNSWKRDGGTMMSVGVLSFACVQKSSCRTQIKSN